MVVTDIIELIAEKICSSIFAICCQVMTIG